MENASNAIIMAGGILIALIVLSIGVYLFANYGRLGESYELKLSAENIAKFNTNFMVFQNRNDIRAQEIITLKNFVDSYNEENGTNIAVICTWIGESPSMTKEQKQKKYIEFLKNYSTEGSTETELVTFTCGSVGTDIKLDENNGMVKEIKFTKN